MRVRSGGVVTPEQLARQARLLARVQSARKDRDRADAEQKTAARQLHEAIRAAYDAGAEVRSIARASGLSRQRVHQIVRRNDSGK